MEASVQIMLILLHDFSVFYSNTLSPLALLDYLNLINLNKFTFAFYKLQNTTKANNKNMNLANNNNFAAAVMAVTKVIGTFPQAEKIHWQPLQNTLLAANVSL